jgi:DNA-directed RNA polymerase subunit beta'
LIQGLVTRGERYNKVIDIWSRANEQVAKAMMEKISTETVETPDGKNVDQSSFNSVYIYADSGARGSPAQIRQLSGMRGLMSKPDGSIIETPITANFREGLSVLQYFISTHGARKGLADTALKTANSGYLTRRLCDVSMDSVINIDDCGTDQSITVTSIIDGGEIIQPLTDRILGRVIAEPIFDSEGNELFAKDTMLDEDAVDSIESLNLASLKVRSPMTCEASIGVCSKCYGRDLARGHLVHRGEAVGVVAAQSIGEPGTQLTMRTFHIGGAASSSSEDNAIFNKNIGVVSFSDDIKTVTNKDKLEVVVSRNAMATITEPRWKDNRAIQSSIWSCIRSQRRIGFRCWCKNCFMVILIQDQLLLKYQVKLNLLILKDGVTVREQMDELTGLSSIEIIEVSDRPTAGRDMSPKVLIQDSKGKTLLIGEFKAPAEYPLQLEA